MNWAFRHVVLGFRPFISFYQHLMLKHASSKYKKKTMVWNQSSWPSWIDPVSTFDNSFSL